MGRESLYTPSEWGKTFHGLKVDYALGAGAAGPGKTTVLLMNDIDIVDHEHHRCNLTNNDPRKLDWGDSVAWILFMRRTSTMLKQTIAKSHRIVPHIDPNARWKSDGDAGTWTFSSGLHYEFASCKDIGSYEKYMSSEYVAINMDELVQFDEEQFDQLKTRIRTSDPYLEAFRRFRAMSNPVMRREGEEAFTVRDPNWVKRFFVDPAPLGRKILKNRVVLSDGTEQWKSRLYLPATLQDNPDKVFVRQYEATLLDAKPHIRNALLFGDWEMSEGSYFAEYWMQPVHMCDPFNIPTGWRKFRSMDWGFKSWGCIHWWAISPDDTLFCFHELSFKGQLDQDVARKVIEIERKWGLAKGGVSMITGPADTQLWEERGDTSRTKAEMFAVHGVVWTKCKKNRQRSAELIIARLKAHKGRTREPGLVLFKQCQKLRKNLVGVQTNPKDPEIPLESKHDHWYDSCCYAVVYADELYGRGFEPDEDDGFDEGDFDDERGRYGYGQIVR